MGLLRKAAGVTEVAVNYDDKDILTETEKKKESSVGESSPSSWLEEDDFHIIHDTGGAAGRLLLTEDLLTEIESYPADLELPVRLFNAIRRFLKFTKAALCVYEETAEAFLSWASCGFDKTTSHRLRLPLTFIHEQVSNSFPNPCFLEISLLDAVKDFFSIREFSSLQGMFFNRFYFKDRVVAVFLSSFGPEDQVDEEIMTEAFKKINDTCAQKLNASRENTQRLTGGAQGALKNDLREELEPLMDKALSDNRKLSVIHIDLSKPISDILKGSECADPFRLRQEVTRIVISMMPENTSVVKQENDKLVLLLLGRSRYDAEIVNMQFTQALGNFFNCPIPPMVNAVLCFPDDCEDTAEFLTLNIS